MIPLLDLKSHYSIKQAYGSPEALVDRAKELGCKSVSLTDYNSISGCINFAEDCKKKGLKSILGCTFSLKEGGRMTTLAKNLDGWKAIIKLVSLSYTAEFFDSINEKPYLTLDKLEEFGTNLIFIIGIPGDLIHTKIFKEPIQHLKRTEILDKIVLDPIVAITRIHTLLGKHSVYIGLSPNGNDYTNWFNEVVRDSGLPTIILSNSHYPTLEDHLYFKLLVCSKLKTTKNKWEKTALEQEPELLRFKDNCWSIPDKSLINTIFTKEEIKKTEEVANSIEEYKILSPPRLPKFVTPNGQTDHEYLKELCRDGWRKKLIGSGKVDNEENKLLYLDRIKRELQAIEENGLSSYFLIVADFIKFIYDNGWRTSPGRGSVGGCLIAYLSNITTIDPIEYGLIFERFWNSARKGSMPDIDVDVPVERREEVIEYIRDKYGRDRVGHLATFGEMKGATAIKEVLRINDACSFEQMNEITKLIPEISRVADEMENTGEDSLLLFTLKYRSEKLQDWVRYNKDTNALEGDMAEWFKLAIKLEGTIQSIGKHASAIIVFEEPLLNVCPMINDKSGTESMVGYNMYSAEKIGCVKLDLLGLSSLSKLLEVNHILKERKSFYQELAKRI